MNTRPSEFEMRGPAPGVPSSNAVLPAIRRAEGAKRAEDEAQRDPVGIHIGHMIRMFRLLRGLSQQDLARQLSVTFQQVQKYERAKTQIASSRLYEIAYIVGAPIELFFNGLNPDQPARTTIGEIVDQYRDISPQFGLQEFVELNRALVGISNGVIRDAVLKIVNETADYLDIHP